MPIIAMVNRLLHDNKDYTPEIQYIVDLVEQRLLHPERGDNGFLEELFGDKDVDETAFPQDATVNNCFRFPSAFTREKAKSVVDLYFQDSYANLALIEIALYDHGQLKYRNHHKAFVKALIAWGILKVENDDEFNLILFGIKDKYRRLSKTMCANYGLEVEIYDMFATQNRHKYMPGVSIIRQVEEQYGERAIEAHILRRIFCNMYIHNYDTPDMTTGLCIAFHQNGIQVGMGPNVKICHNQCMLNPQLYASTYGLKGEGRGSGLSVQGLLEAVGGWLEDSSTLAKRDTELANAMLNTKVNKTAAIEMIGQLTAIRVKADSSNTLIRENIDYPLNQGQISAFAEDVLVQYKLKETVNLWDIYNAGTLLFKAERMDIPQIMPQNRAFMKFLISSMFFNDLQDKVSWNLTQDLVEYGVEVL